MPFLTTIRYSEFGLDSKGNSRLQITDLFPNKSQSNAVITPRFQGPYNFRPVDAQSAGNALEVLPALDGALDIDAEVSGLAAYFLAVVEDQANSTNIEPAEALSIAGDMIANMQDGSPLTLAEINGYIELNAGVGSDLDGAGVGSNSTGSVLEVLQILCGAKTFTLPKGHSVGDNGNQNAFTPFVNADTQAAAFSAVEGYTSIPSTHDSFYMSARSGQIKTAQLNLNSNNHPVLVAYDDDGSVVK
jgi:hypothetical protein